VLAITVIAGCNGGGSGGSGGNGGSGGSASTVKLTLGQFTTSDGTEFAVPTESSELVILP
jgi:hypothetical protein